MMLLIDQMIMDLDNIEKISGFRKMHSEFDRFIQDAESKAAFFKFTKKQRRNI